MTRGDRTNLVLAIRIECGEPQLGEIRPTQGDRRLAPRVPDHQITAAVLGRQHDDERAKHAGRFLRVPMRFEETSGVVHQQLVELGRNARALASQPSGHSREDCLERTAPRLSANRHVARRHLPDLTHTGVDDGSGAAPIRRAGGVFDELLNLKRRNGKRKNPNAVHFHCRHGQLEPIGDVIVPGPLDPG